MINDEFILLKNLNKMFDLVSVQKGLGLTSGMGGKTK
jgi:hypothetical protein